MAAFGAYRARGEKVIARHMGLETIGDDPDARFSLVGFLRALAELQEQFGAQFMRKVASSIFDKAIIPPGMDTAMKSMEMSNVGFYMNHSADAKGKLGGFVWTATGTRGGTMKASSPYPCAFDMGNFESIARRFEPTAKLDHVPGSCRHEGGDFCMYRVEW